jgi:hypothetical protein
MCAVEGGRARPNGAVWHVGVVGRRSDDHCRSNAIGEARWLGKHSGVPLGPSCRGGGFSLCGLSERGSLCTNDGGQWADVVQQARARVGNGRGSLERHVW